MLRWSRITSINFSSSEIPLKALEILLMEIDCNLTGRTVFYVKLPVTFAGYNNRL